jgi:C-terminal processing protease CtpA/Prc
MPRFPIAVVSALLAGLLAIPGAIAQESPKADPPAEKPETKAQSEKAAAEAESAVLQVHRALMAQSKVQATQEQSEAQRKQIEAEQKFLNYRQSLITYNPRFQADTLEEIFGLGLADADDALRAQLEVPNGQGVVVVSVKKSGLADQAGLRVNDVLLSLGDQPAKSAEQLRNALLRLDGEAPQVKLIRQGKPTQLSVAGPKHGVDFVQTDYYIGVPVSPVDATLRAHLPSLSADSGLVVNDVVEGSPAQKAGVHKNDILVALGGKPLKDSAALIEQVKATEGKPVALDLLRAGKPITVQVTPEKRAGTVTFRTRFDSPLTLRHTYDVVRPNMAILDGKAEPGVKGDIKLLPGEKAGQSAKRLNLRIGVQSDGDKLQNLNGGDANSAKLLEQMKALKTDLDRVVKSLEGLSKLDRIVNDLDELLKKPAAK